MNITNTLNLPTPIVAALQNIEAERDEAGADITVTGLEKPPRMRELERLHRDEITQDASAMVNILLGQLMHALLEKAHVEDSLVEERLAMDVDGWKVSGQLDHFTLDGSGELSDYKLTQVFTIQIGREEWTKQGNMYAHLLRQHGHEVKSLRVVAFGRDWMQSQATRSPKYPQAQVTVIPLELWSPAQCDAYLRERVNAHKAARFELPHCTDEERWERGKGPVRCNAWCLVRQQCEARHDGQWATGF